MDKVVILARVSTDRQEYKRHGRTVAEIIYERANADKDFMGLTAWTGALPTRSDAD